MPANTPPPTCKTCGKLMKWLPAKSGGRKFCCLDCDSSKPSKSTETLEFLSGTLDASSKFFQRLEGHAKKARDDIEKLPPGEKRDALMQEILEMQRAIYFNPD